MILCFDTIQEFRAQCNGRDIFKTHLERILDHQRQYRKQRATSRHVKVGEENTKYFQAKATIKFRNNCITMLKDEQGHEHHDHHANVAILQRAFKDRLGTCIHQLQTPSNFTICCNHWMIYLNQKLHSLRKRFIGSSNICLHPWTRWFQCSISQKLLGYHCHKLL